MYNVIPVLHVLLLVSNTHYLYAEYICIISNNVEKCVWGLWLPWIHRSSYALND